MRQLSKKGIALLIIAILIIALGTAYFSLGNRPAPNNIQYGVSFNTLYAQELHLNWQETYDAVLGDLGVKHLRLAAHWNMIEPQDDAWNFSELDYQIDQAEAHGADIVLAIGRRLPRWPECHVPSWAVDASWEDQKTEIREYISAVMNRYKDRPAIVYWQVENEPFLEVFAFEHCGELDVAFLDEEISLMKSIDPTRPILVTDSGNLGTWRKPYSRGDAFGTSVYVYLWNPEVGPFKSFLPPSFYQFKTSVMELVYGKKETMLIELSLEPWLLQPVVETPRAVQLERMNIDKFREVIDFAADTHFEKQYLWGAEWWYFMKLRGYPAFWDEATKLFSE